MYAVLYSSKPSRWKYREAFRNSVRNSGVSRVKDMKVCSLVNERVTVSELLWYVSSQRKKETKKIESDNQSINQSISCEFSRSVDLRFSFDDEILISTLFQNNRRIRKDKRSLRFYIISAMEHQIKWFKSYSTRLCMLLLMMDNHFLSFFQIRPFNRMNTNVSRIRQFLSFCQDKDRRKSRVTNPIGLFESYKERESLWSIETGWV